MSRSVIGLAAAILVSLSQAAVADGYPLVPRPTTPGAISQRLSPRQVFQLLDTNHDGVLSLNEFLAAPWVRNPQRATRVFRWMDTNHDGLVSLQEFLAAYNCCYSIDENSLQAAYPWAWVYWRPWSCGWYWNNGWCRRAGDWGYAWHRHKGRHGRPGHWRGRSGHSHHVGRPHRHAKHVKHPGRGRHIRHRGRHGVHRRHAHRR